MEHFQNKIRKMREVIDNIKLDIETIRNTKRTTPCKPLINDTTSHSSNKTKKINSHYTHNIIKTDLNQSNTNYNNFKSNCLNKKEHTQISLTLSSHRLKNTNKANPRILNNNREISEDNQPFGTFSHINPRNNEITKMQESHNEQKKNKSSTMNDYNYKGNLITKQANFNNTNKTNNVIHNHYGLSEDFKNIRTESNNQSEPRFISDNHIVTPQHLYTHTNDHLPSKTICFEKQPEVKEYKEIIDKLINLSNRAYANNQLNKNREVSYDNIIEYYQNAINQLHQKNELIEKMYELYASSHGTKILMEKESHLILWNWIKQLSRQNRKMNCSNSKNEYQFLCQNIMKKYNLENINELALFIDNLLKKSNKNECFIEGITNMLLTNNKN